MQRAGTFGCYGKVQDRSDYFYEHSIGTFELQADNQILHHLLDGTIVTPASRNFSPSFLRMRQAGYSKLSFNFVLYERLKMF